MVALPVGLRLRAIAEQAGDAKAEKPHDDPHGIEHCGGLKDVEDGRPQLAQRRVVMDDGVDVETNSYDEADEQREQLGADATGSDIDVGHGSNEE